MNTKHNVTIKKKYVFLKHCLSAAFTKVINFHNICKRTSYCNYVLNQKNVTKQTAWNIYIKLKK